MSEENQPILPLLKDSAWQYHDKSVCRRLAPDLESPYLPFVGFGYDNPHTFQFLPEEGGGSRNIAIIERRALENMRNMFPAKWERHNVKIGPFQKLTMILCGNNFFSAERILDTEFMIDGAKMLKCKRIIVGVPSRGTLLATSGDQSMKMLSHFAGIVSVQYHQTRTAPISPLAFVIEEGKIIGLLKGGEEIGKAIPAPKPSDDLYINVLSAKKEETGQQMRVIAAGSKDLDELSDAITSAFNQTLADCLGDEEFDGEIRVLILDTLTPDTPELRATIDTLQEKLSGIAADIQRMTDSAKRIPVSVRYMVGDNLPE
jgi:hypothetical protein